MLHLLGNIKRAKKLIAEDDKRIELERLRKLKEEQLKEEISELSKKDIAYIQKYTELDIKQKEINLATVYKEVNRIQHLLYFSIPTAYIEIFGEEPPVVFDSVYIRNAEFTPYEKSLTEIEAMLSKSSKNDNWPPQKVDLDCFNEACYYALHNWLVDDIKNLKKLLTLINSYS